MSIDVLPGALQRRPDRLRTLAGLVLASLLIAGGAAAQEPAAMPEVGDGRTVFVRTLTTAEAGGVQRALAQKDWVYVADTLRTSANGTARFVMRDHTLLALKPGTTVELAEYQFKAEDSTASKMVTKVTSGGLRALTGLIDKRDPDKVVLQTPLATAGVRGTALRVDIYPSKEEIIFDFGHGWVGNLAGRVNVEQGWGARVVSATILPELFKVEEDRLEPASIALDLLGRGPPDIRIGVPLPSDPNEREGALDELAEKAARIGKTIDPANRVVLIGILEQVPNPEPERTLAILTGLLGASPEHRGELIETEIHLVPTRAPQVFEVAVSSGMEREAALRTVLGALLPLWPGPVDEVLKKATDLGISPPRGQEILETIRQSIPCRPTPVPPSPESDEPQGESQAVAGVREARPDLSPIGLEYSVAATAALLHSGT